MFQKNRVALLFFIGWATFLPFFNSYGDESSTTWEEWVNAQPSVAENIAVQNRLITKAGRFQIVGPLFGMSDRKDFYTTYVMALGARFHFTEKHAWEFLNLNFSLPLENDLANQIRQQTGFQPDVQLSRFQMSTSYVYTPIYGKYAWGENRIVHFDIFGSVGGGVRFSNTFQPFGELGLGMNHFIFSNRFSIVPEVRERVYSEQRTSSVMVYESIFQLGIACLL